MEFNKKKLVSIIKEVNEIQSDVDEMAIRKKEVQAQRTKAGEKIIPRVLNVWKDDNPTQVGQEGHPDAFVINPTQTPGDQILLVPYECEDLSQFIEQNREWLESIGALYEVENEKFEYCKGKYAFPPSKYRKPVSGQKISPETKNKSIFLEMIRLEFDKNTPKGSEFDSTLSKLSIPSIVLDKKHLDNYGDSWDNQKIEFRTHTINTYESAQSFLNNVIKRIAGRESDPTKDDYLARQYNPVYRNWEAERKSTKMYKGETPKYKLNVQGYVEPNLDVSLKMEFTIRGEKIGGSWNWTISMTNKFGRKSPDEYFIKKGLKDYTLRDSGYLDEGKLSVSKEIPYPNKDFSGGNVIMEDISIVSSLEETISDFKNMISQINPKSALKIANITRQDIQRDVNETVQSVLKNIKKIKNVKSS